MQSALSMSGEWRRLVALTVAVAACGGKGGLRFTGGSSQDGVGTSSGDAGGESADGLRGSGGSSMEGTGGVATTGGMTASGGVASQGGSAGSDQVGGVIDAGTNCPPAPTVLPQYSSQLLTDPTTGCVLSVYYTNSDAGVSCAPLNLPPTLCLSSLLPISDPITGCATGFKCAFSTDCALGAGCPTTDAGVDCPPLPFPTQFCVVLLTVVDPSTGCVVAFTCKSPMPF